MVTSFLPFLIECNGMRNASRRLRLVAAVLGYVASIGLTTGQPTGNQESTIGEISAIGNLDHQSLVAELAFTRALAYLNDNDSRGIAYLVESLKIQPEGNPALVPLLLALEVWNFPIPLADSGVFPMRAPGNGGQFALLRATADGEFEIGGTSSLPGETDDGFYWRYTFNPDGGKLTKFANPVLENQSFPESESLIGFSLKPVVGVPRLQICVPEGRVNSPPDWSLVSKSEQFYFLGTGPLPWEYLRGGLDTVSAAMTQTGIFALLYEVSDGFRAKAFKIRNREFNQVFQDMMSGARPLPKPPAVIENDLEENWTSGWAPALDLDGERATNPPWLVSFSPDGTTVAVGVGSELLMLDVRTKQMIKRGEVYGEAHPPKSICWSANSGSFAMHYEGINLPVEVWPTGKPSRRLGIVDPREGGIVSTACGSWFVFLKSVDGNSRFVSGITMVDAATGGRRYELNLGREQIEKWREDKPSPLLVRRPTESSLILFSEVTSAPNWLLSLGEALVGTTVDEDGLLVESSAPEFRFKEFCHQLADASDPLVDWGRSFMDRARTE